MVPRGPYVSNSCCLRMGSCSVISCLRCGGAAGGGQGALPTIDVAGRPQLALHGASLCMEPLPRSPHWSASDNSLVAAVWVAGVAPLRHVPLGLVPDLAVHGGDHVLQRMGSGEESATTCNLRLPQHAYRQIKDRAPHSAPAPPWHSAPAPPTCSRPVAMYWSISVRSRRMYIWRVRGTASTASMR